MTYINFVYKSFFLVFSNVMDVSTKATAQMTKVLKRWISKLKRKIKGWDLVTDDFFLMQFTLRTAHDLLFQFTCT